MIPKMVILNPKEYQYKFDEAMAYSLSDQHEKALNLLLELKEKRWRKFELFKTIVEQYMALDQYNQAQLIMKEIKPTNENEKGELLELELLIKNKMERKQLNIQQQKLYQNQEQLQERIFEETQELKQQQQAVQLIENKNIEDVNLNDLHILFRIRYCYSIQCVLEYLNYQKIFSKIDDNNQHFILNQTISNEKYELTLNLSEMIQENQWKSFVQAYCFKQMKQYKQALQILKRCLQFKINYQTLLNSMYLHYLLFIKFDQNTQIHATFDSSLIDYIQIDLVNIIQIKIILNNLSILNFQFSQFTEALSQEKIKIIQMIKIFIDIGNNCQMYLYSELFLMEYQISPNNPILQRICDFLIKYAPRYSAGYVHQYQLFIDQKLMEKVFALEQPLEECEDCALKYITLAKLYKEKKQYAQAHKALEQAKRLNEFNEEIYQIEIDLLRIQKMYQQAYKTLRHLVQLERENYRFICSTIAPLIDKYEYYRVIDLLQLVDDESWKFDELKLLLRIIVSKQSKQEDQQIMQSIESLDQNQVMEFLGHYWLSKNQVKDSQQFYEQIEFKPMFVTDQKHYNYQKNIIASIKLIDKLKQREITDIICQIGIYSYIPSQDKSIIIHQRYITTIGFALTSIVFNNNQDQNVQIINSKYDMEVPKIDGFKLRLIQIIEKNFFQSYITSEKYQTYVERGLLQLQKLFTSTDIFMDCLYDFSDQYKQQMIELFNYIDHEVVQVDEDLQTIYSIPFFADPISRYALVSVIKMIGYFTEFELVNNYQGIEEWLTVYMIKYNIEAYYQQIMKNKQNNQN